MHTSNTGLFPKTGVPIALALALLLGGCANMGGGGDRRAETPPAGYEPVHELVALPAFIPGLGSLHVQPETLPAGPFLAYDREGTHVSTIYMIPVEDLETQKAFDSLEATGKPTVSTALYYNAGHPGVEVPHYHVVLWHVAPDSAVMD